MLAADKKKLKTLICGCALMLLMSGCGAKKQVLYIQNALPDAVEKAISRPEVKVTSGDELMIFVTCEDPETSQKLSLMGGTRRPDFTNPVSNNTTVMLPYLVNDEGDIDMPLVGPVHVAGLNRQQISKLVAQKVVEAKLANPGTVNVTVQYANMNFSVLGEVLHPGAYSITDDRTSVLEALAMAGDLTIHGRRDKVWVIREDQAGNRKMMCLDLRDSKFMQSPGYYIEQNDVIYVEPNEVRAGQSTINENTFKSVSFWTTLTSVAISLTTLIVTLTRR